MPILQLAKKFSVENPAGVWGVTDCDGRSLHYLLSCYTEYEFLRFVGHVNPTPDLVSVSLTDNIYCSDIDFMGVLANNLIDNSKEPDIQELMAKIYWCLLNSGADELGGLLEKFFKSVESA